MAINIATSSNLADAQRIVIAEARYTEEHKAVMKQLVTHFTLGKGEKSINVPKFATVSASALTDGVDLASPTSVTNTTKSITTAEVGLLIVLSDKLIRQMVPDMFRVAGRLAGNAMGKKLDQDLLALFSGIDAGVGASGTVITTGYITAAVAKCFGASEPAPAPLACVLHPYQVRKIMDALAPVGTYPIPDGYSKEVLSKYFSGSLKTWGVPIYFDGNVDNSTAAATYGAVFSKDCLYLATQKEWSVERERDATLRATELVVVADYAVGELDGVHGQYLLFDATAPTS